MLRVDGSQGEGGGQILRSALSLSIATGRACRVFNIRARRRRPGLMRQHLTALLAAAEVCGGEVEGGALGSGEIVFRPGRVRGGRYRFAVGSGGSATLVLQTVLPPLLTADAPSELLLEGGTHNPWSPPFDFLEKTFLPLISRMGPAVSARLEAHGFYPAGGGRFAVRVEPAQRLAPLELLERGGPPELYAHALVSRLPRHIAERELAVLCAALSIPPGRTMIEEAESPGPGNAAMVEARAPGATELFTGFGMRGVRAEEVAAALAAEVRTYLAADVPVGAHLADQLLLPLALAGGGAYRTLAPTPHLCTNIAVVRAFLDLDVRLTEDAGGAWMVQVGEAGAIPHRKS